MMACPFQGERLLFLYSPENVKMINKGKTNKLGLNLFILKKNDKNYRCIN
jgi:hypothetical protein